MKLATGFEVLLPHPIPSPGGRGGKTAYRPAFVLKVVPLGSERIFFNHSDSNNPEIRVGSQP